jgi:osmoprotectant transport system ATP-binding protein
VTLRAEAVDKTLGGRPAVRGISLDFDPGITVLLGPSGCGKSTLLRLLVGLLRPDAGRVTLDGADVRPGPRFGYCIQDGGLFPHLDAWGNVALLARHLGWPRERVEARIAELAALVRIDPAQLRRHPDALSGGQRQRVALMRALMTHPEVLLLDEPMGALDPLVRADLQEDLRGIFRTLRTTVVLVTHDLGEAAFLADRIVVMRDGAVVQVGSVADLVHRPADAFVARYVRAQRTVLT